MHKILTLEPLNNLSFVARHHQESFRGHIFGGQVLAQALMAAALTAEQRPIHSLHAYFLRIGSIHFPIQYDVELLRDGKTVSSRLVKGYQNGKLIFSLMASFHDPEIGFKHQHTPQNTSFSKITPPADALLNTLAPELGELKNAPIDFIADDHSIFDTQIRQHVNGLFWFKTRAPLPLESHYHTAALAFASDLGLLATTLLTHPTSLFAGKIQPASIDHSLWFHRPTDFSEWHLYTTESPWVDHGRGFARGFIYNQQMELVASVCQEGMIRPLS